MHYTDQCASLHFVFICTYPLCILCVCGGDEWPSLSPFTVKQEAEEVMILGFHTRDLETECVQSCLGWRDEIKQKTKVVFLCPFHLGSQSCTLLFPITCLRSLLPLSQGYPLESAQHACTRILTVCVCVYASRTHTHTGCLYKMIYATVFYYFQTNYFASPPPSLFCLCLPFPHHPFLNIVY